MKLCAPVIMTLAMVSMLATSPMETITPHVGGLELSKPRTEVQSKFDFDLEVYADRISKQESGFDEKAISRSGLYVGLYQIGDLALKDVGVYPDISVKKFKRDRSVFPKHKQREVLFMIAEKNQQYLGKMIHKYEGRVIGGYKITEAGMLAAAHHIGATAVKQFLNSDGRIVKTDGSGVKMTKFIREMEDGCGI